MAGTPVVAHRPISLSGTPLRHPGASGANLGRPPDGRITRIYAVRNPHKLARLDGVAALTRI